MKQAVLLVAALAATSPATAQETDPYLAEIEALMAEIPPLAGELLASDDPMARLTGALALCMVGVTDPETAMATLEGAGWNAIEGEAGDIGYDFDGTFDTTVTVATVPGLCLVQSISLGTQTLTEAMIGTLDGLGWPAGDISDDGAGGCVFIDLRIGATASITGSGDDVACTAPDNSEVRFNIADV